MKTAKEWKGSARVGGQKRLVKFLRSCRALDHGAPAWHFDRYRGNRPPHAGRGNAAR